MSAVSCNKSQPEDPAITSVKAGCVGDWTGEIESKSVTVWVELDNSPARVMAIEINGVNMNVTTESADLKAVIPSSMTKLLK